MLIFAFCPSASSRWMDFVLIDAALLFLFALHSAVCVCMIEMLPTDVLVSNAISNRELHALCGFVV